MFRHVEASLGPSVSTIVLSKVAVALLVVFVRQAISRFQLHGGGGGGGAGILGFPHLGHILILRVLLHNA